jgi:UDP-glucuronate decarboxylase
VARTYDNRKRILVTGGAGFLGSHLIDRLVEQGHEVVCVDNFFTGTKRNIEHHFGQPLVEVIRHDVSFPLYVEVDEIYNLACPASPIHYQHDPVQTTKTSVHGAINMLGLAKRLGCKILQASTSEVYGDPEVHPQREDYWGHVNPVGPRACYDEGKRCAETLFFDFHRRRGVAIKVARIFTTYGPRMDPADGRVVSNFIVQALKGEPISMYGDGSQTRSFCYVDDLVDGLVRLMESGPELVGPVNLGNPGEFTVRALAEKVAAATGSKAGFRFEPLPVDDPRQRQPDIGLARSKLGWAPRIDLDRGLELTIAHFRGLVSAA